MSRLLAVSLLLGLVWAAAAHAARTFSDNTYLSVSAAVVSVPFTFCAWVRPTQVVSNDLFGLVVSASGDNRHRVEINSSSQLNIVSRTTTDGGSALISPLVQANVWQHVCAVFAATNSRSAYLNGTNKVSNSSTRDAVGMNLTYLARASPTVGAREFNGQMEHAALWSAALSDAEVVALSKGVCPRRVRAASLAAYVPIWGLHSPELDVAAARAWTITGSTTQPSFGAPVSPCTR